MFSTLLDILPFFSLILAVCGVLRLFVVGDGVKNLKR
jgi:hypothetical protein